MGEARLSTNLIPTEFNSSGQSDQPDFSFICLMGDDALARQQIAGIYDRHRNRLYGRALVHRLFSQGLVGNLFRHVVGCHQNGFRLVDVPVRLQLGVHTLQAKAEPFFALVIVYAQKHVGQDAERTERKTDHRLGPKPQKLVDNDRVLIVNDSDEDSRRVVGIPVEHDIVFDDRADEDKDDIGVRGYFRRRRPTRLDLAAYSFQVLAQFFPFAVLGLKQQNPKSSQVLYQDRRGSFIR
nr:hypothetical protein [Mesorhizobium sp. Root552]